MSPEVIKRRLEWAEALESGKYKQGRGQLRSKLNRFCCLGVACDIYDGSRWSKQPNKCGNFEYGDMYTTHLSNQEVQAAFGLDANDEDQLADLNDNGYTFEEIAKIIRSTTNGQS